jgi:N-acetylneuraminic acid mutarotase
MWKYDDAGCFTKVTTTNSYTPRYGHQAVVHNGAIYVIGGIDNTFTKLSDVWKYDGSDWSKVSDGFALDSGGRVYHKAVSFGGKIYSVGGQGEQGYPYQIGGVYSDVLVSSDDGVTWSNALSDSAPNSEVSTYAKEDEYHVKEYWDSLNSDVTDTSIFDTSKYPKGKAGVFSSRTGHNLVVFDNKMWLIGGVSTEGNVMGGNDIYSSSDGISWTKERKTTLNTSGEEYRFSRRFDSAVVVNGTDIILVGGQKLDAGSNDKQNQVWISHDMIKWEQLVNYPVKF